MAFICYSFVDILITGIPLSEIPENFAKIRASLLKNSSAKKKCIVTVCRRGNDSQRAVVQLLNLMKQFSIDDIDCFDIEGGVAAWKDGVDENFVVL